MSILALLISASLLMLLLLDDRDHHTALSNSSSGYRDSKRSPDDHFAGQYFHRGSGRREITPCV